MASDLTWINFEKEIFVLVHPDVHGAQRVVVEDAHDAARPRVGRHLAEHVTDARARGDQHRAATLPHLVRWGTRRVQTNMQL